MPINVDNKEIEELFEIYNRAYGAKDPKEKASIYMEHSKRALERNFGVKDLTDIEGGSLKKYRGKRTSQIRERTSADI